MTLAKLHLLPEAFSHKEKVVLEFGPFEASAFLFETGVAGLRLKTDVGELVVLPFQGQQIWSATMGGRELGMKSVCTVPIAGVPFLQTFGGFLQHCGIEGMGDPGPTDRHPLHGELPNAPYQRAWLEFGEDSRGAFLSLTGQYFRREVFGSHYVAEPRLVLRQGSTLFSVTFSATNLKNAPMDLMYLAHINFRTAYNGVLHYSAFPAPERVRVRRNIPSHIRPKPSYGELIRTLMVDPGRHHILDAELDADPEIAFYIDYLADADGWAHSLQTHPDESSDYVAHRPGQLPRATRWISRTPDHDAIALVEPGTAEVEGYHAEKQKGNILSLGAGQTFRAEMRMGVVNPSSTDRLRKVILGILSEA